MTLTSNCGKSYYVRYFLKKISIPAETKNESFLTSCSTSKNDVLTYIFNDLTSKVGPRRPSVAPISPGRGKNLPRWAPPSAWRCQSTFQSVAGPAPYRVRGVAGSGSLALSILINHTAHHCREFPKPQRSITHAIQSAGERGKIFPYPGEISPRRPPVKSS